VRFAHGARLNRVSNKNFFFLPGRSSGIDAALDRADDAWVSVHSDLQILSFQQAGDTLKPEFLRRALAQKSPLIPAGFGLMGVVALLLFGFVYESVLSWKTILPSSLLLILVGKAWLAQRRDGIRAALRRPEHFRLCRAAIADVRHSWPVRFETIDGQRRFVPMSYRASGEPYVTLQLELSEGDQKLCWAEECGRAAWQAVFTDDLELMRDPPPEGIEPFRVRFPIDVLVLHQAGAHRGWLIGIPAHTFQKESRPDSLHAGRLG
jgi:hypothetical protein